MISYLGSLVQFSPGAGRAGRCRQLSLCVGSLRRVLAGQPEAWHALSTGAPRPLPPRPQRAARSGLRESSDRTRGLFAGWDGVASLGLSFPLAPPPASYLLRVVFIFQPGWLKDSSTDKETLTQYTVIYSRPHY